MCLPVAFREDVGVAMAADRCDIVSVPVGTGIVGGKTPAGKVLRGVGFCSGHGSVGIRA